ncbi:DEAD/DEAH box helicase [Pedobacter glucosidilyticus]|uniref:DEAD/DEAH box helicase n=1 Tax=Pedobacter glucosidilyticus TaxID=1122941 RepID=UPI0026EB60C8|nr:DEAD/DEAH box helicase [Pedobacter glucosidilyticus]
MKNFESIYNNRCLNAVLEKNVINLLSQKIRSISKVKTDPLEVRKAVWLASILAESKDEQHLKKVQDLAILLFLNNQNNIETLKVSYILFSRIGNLTATRHLQKLGNTDESNSFNEDVVLIQELINKRLENSILVNDKPYLLTDFQKDLFKTIKEEKYVSISAPTSSGKSFILKICIEEELKVKENYCVYYIVPSRALINQVSEELRENIDDILVKNAFIEDNIELDKKVIYVITPERAIKIINSEKGLLLPNLIFIDEIQNVENEDGRGNLFEYVYEEFSKIDKTKIITAGPFISNPKEIFKELFDKESKIVDSNLSPVFQLKTIIELNQDAISLKLFINNKAFYKLDDIITIEKIEAIFKSNYGKGLSKIIAALTNANERNLVYAPDGYMAETWALEYAKSITDIDNILQDDLNDLIKYLKTDIHPKYYLVECLKKKIAFHSSNLSEFARKEIENLFERGIIKTLFCTSTLLEGVNLPADNLFVIIPKKNTEKLTDFEFGNLIGRAGRIKNTLYGTIYCVSKENKTDWAEEYYEASYTKEVKTSSSRALPEITSSDLKKTSTEIDSKKNKNIITSLRNKALKNDGSLEIFFDKHNLEETKKINFINQINDSIKDVQIPYDVIKQNPTIDPLLQDKLYKDVINDILSWVIDPKSFSISNQRREDAEKLEYKDKSSYWQLHSVILRLDEMFKISYESWKSDNLNDVNPSTICTNTFKWIQGNSLGEIIASAIKYYSSDLRISDKKRINPSNSVDINRKIKEVIKITNKVITFNLLRYIKLLVDILENILNDEQKETYKSTLGLASAIELGSQDKLVITMITNGIPRTISLNLKKIFVQTDFYKNDKENADVLKWLKSQDYVTGLEPIYNKFLAKNNFLNVKIYK